MKLFSQPIVWPILGLVSAVLSLALLDGGALRVAASIASLSTGLLVGALASANWMIRALVMRMSAERRAFTAMTVAILQKRADDHRRMAAEGEGVADVHAWARSSLLTVIEEVKSLDRPSEASISAELLNQVKKS